jgi:hypothetical protein
VIVENAHYKFNKSNFDNTYKEAEAVKANDKKLWKKWYDSEFENFFNRVKVLLDQS